MVFRRTSYLFNCGQTSFKIRIKHNNTCRLYSGYKYRIVQNVKSAVGEINGFRHLNVRTKFSSVVIYIYNN